MDGLMKWVATGVVALGSVVVLAAIHAFLIWWAWNFVVPTLFGLREIGWLEAYALSLLAGSLIKPILRCDHGKP